MWSFIAHRQLFSTVFLTLEFHERSTKIFPGWHFVERCLWSMFFCLLCLSHKTNRHELGCRQVGAAAGAKGASDGDEVATCHRGINCLTLTMRNECSRDHLSDTLIQMMAVARSIGKTLTRSVSIHWWHTNRTNSIFLVCVCRESDELQCPI